MRRRFLIQYDSWSMELDTYKWKIVVAPNLKSALRTIDQRVIAVLDLGFNPDEYPQKELELMP